MPVDQKEDRILLHHPNGSLALILIFGATVISWKSPSLGSLEPTERLFLSSKSALDGSKAVRGGIPVVFPCFGAPTHKEHLALKQHGFARSERWVYDGVVMDNDAGVAVRFVLEPTTKIQALYDRPFRLDYVVTLAGHQLSTNLHVHNPSTSDILEYQALLHTYIKAPAYDVTIAPLNGRYFYDKTEDTAEGKLMAKLEKRERVDVKIFTDSVYEDALQHYDVTWPSGGIQVRSRNMKDVVIWNPGNFGRDIVDLEDRGWERFVCVEPGHVKGFIRLGPGETWIGQQVLTVTPDQQRSDEVQ